MNSALRFWQLPAAAALLLCAGAAWASQPQVPDNMSHRVAACTSCHGPDGAGSASNPSIPRLAGKPEAYLFQQLRYFQEGERTYAPMQYVVKQLSPAYLHTIAHYFATKNVPVTHQPVPTVAPAVMERGRNLVLHGDKANGVPSCDSCHGKKLTGVEPMIPGLMGLSYAYIDTQLKLWREHKRANGGTFCMGVVANRMASDDVKAVAVYLASQKAPANLQPIPASEQTQPLPGWCVLGNKDREAAK